MVAWDHLQDWVLQRFWPDRTRVAILFRQRPPSVADLLAVRRCLPQFRDKPPAVIRALVPDSGVLALGVLPTPEARRLIEAAKGEGLDVVAESASFVSYLPYDRTTRCAWLIEDEAEAAAITQSMLAACVPRPDIE